MNLLGTCVFLILDSFHLFVENQRYHRHFSIKGICAPHMCVFISRHSSNWNPHRLHSELFSAKRKTQRRAPVRHLRWRFDRRRRPHQDRRYPSHRWILSCHHVLPNKHRTGKPSRKPRIGVELHWRWPPAQRKLQDDAQLSQVWTRRTQPNSWRSMSGTPWTPKYPLRRSCRRQSDVSAKQRPVGRSSIRVSGKALQNFAPNF
jgi:hypothetical protein